MAWQYGMGHDGGVSLNPVAIRPRWESWPVLADNDDDDGSGPVLETCPVHLTDRTTREVNRIRSSFG